MKDQTAVMCHNIAKYNREHQEPEMTPLEIVENLAFIVDAQMIKRMGSEADELYQSVELATSLLRKIASGEYAPVVHGRWTRQSVNAHRAGYSVCYYNHAECEVNPCGLVKAEYDHCPFCGARMRKDDSHENN